MRRRLIVAALAALCFFPASQATVGQQPDLPSTTKPAYTKVESQLSDLAQRAIQDGVLASAQLAAGAPASLNGQVAVTIHHRNAPAAIARAVEQRAGVVANVEADLVEAYVDLLDVPDLSEHPLVERVTLIRPPKPLGSPRRRSRAVGFGNIVSEGVIRHNARAYHNADMTGQGVKVGVIDVGFEGIRTAQANGELPGQIRRRCYTRVGRFNQRLAACEADTAHGTAVAEALLDIAPGVTLYVANPVSLTDLQRTVRWMANRGVKVVNYSVSHAWSGPGDGTSRFSNSALKTVADAVQRGILWVNAAGNEGRSTWSGAYRDRDNDGVLEFNNNRLERNRVRLARGESVIILLRWDDTWGGAATDLDLYLRTGSGTLVARSVDRQNGASSDDPIEGFSFTAPRAIGGAAATLTRYFVRVEHFAGPAPAWWQVQAFTSQILQRRQAGRSVGEPADSADPGVLAVGASNQLRAAALERFSSRGPTRDDRVKPDIVGVDNADSDVWGPWFGTSQASPHVAGLAALLLQTNPTMTPVQLSDSLKESARRRGSPRPNNTWGYGLAWLRTPR
ncbi:MAG: hypothetical protein CL471_06155 [Acidobacteria bacterium]|nr:hypothetical protein [Acidobacteriota bacterium]